MNHEYYMKEALQEAKRAYGNNEVPIGAVLVLNGEIIARGHNQRVELEKTAAHAEMMTIEKANEALGYWRLDDAVLYTTVEPCMMCAGTIVQARVKTVVYGAKDHKAGCGGSIHNLLQEPRFNHQCDVITGVLEEECTEILQNFFKELRDKKKKHS